MNIEILKEMGNEWQKGDKHRIYFNDLGAYYGIETERYNTGNICGATQDGERISNSEAKRILGRLLDCKVWYDLNDNQWYSQYNKGDETAKAMCREIIARIKKFVAEKSAELETA